MVTKGMTAEEVLSQLGTGGNPDLLPNGWMARQEIKDSFGATPDSFYETYSQAGALTREAIGLMGEPWRSMQSDFEKATNPAPDAPAPGAALDWKFNK